LSLTEILGAQAENLGAHLKSACNAIIKKNLVALGLTMNH